MPSGKIADFQADPGARTPAGGKKARPLMCSEVPLFHTNALTAVTYDMI